MICIIKWRWGLLRVLFFREENTININKEYFIRRNKIFNIYACRIKIRALNVFLYVHHQYTNDILYVYVKEKAR